jgi:hypothetical protein
MEADTSWTYGKQKFHFGGCSAARLVNMVAENGQIQQTESPLVIIMTAGGNNANFGEIIDNCIYQGDPTVSYGPPYDDDLDGKGLCKKSLATGQAYINNSGTDGLATQFRQTLDDIFKTDQARSHDEFWLYVTGYAHFFNVDTDECDNWSFSPNTTIYNRPTLTKTLRVEINQILTQFNDIYVRFPFLLPRLNFTVPQF